MTRRIIVKRTRTHVYDLSRADLSGMTMFMGAKDPHSQRAAGRRDLLAGLIFSPCRHLSASRESTGRSSVVLFVCFATSKVLEISPCDCVAIRMVILLVWDACVSVLHCWLLNAWMFMAVGLQ